MSPSPPGALGWSQLSSLYQIQLTARQKEQLRLYADLLLFWNRRLSLVGNLSLAELLRFHFLECLWAAQVVAPQFQRVADVGSGAGFPGILFLISQPERKVWLLESSLKKRIFLQELCRKLGLSPAGIEGRAEEFRGWGELELVTFRAFRPSPRLLRLWEGRHLHFLLFHGARGFQPQELPARILRREKVPGTRQRWVTLLRSDPLRCVSRETG